MMQVFTDLIQFNHVLVLGINPRLIKYERTWEGLIKIDG